MNVDIVREWLDHVQADMDAAWSCARGPRARTDRAAYFVQQAGEKLMKAALVSADIDPPYTHDIEALWRLLPHDFPDRPRFGTLVAFTPYAHGLRYPTGQAPPPTPSPSDVDRWVDQIAGIKINFERWLDERQAGGGG